MQLACRPSLAPQSERCLHALAADAQGNLVGTFHVDAVKDIIAKPSAELTLTGYVDGGVYFSGSDTVRVIDHSGRR